MAVTLFEFFLKVWLTPNCTFFGCKSTVICGNDLPEFTNVQEKSEAVTDEKQMHDDKNHCGPVKCFKITKIDTYVSTYFFLT